MFCVDQLLTLTLLIYYVCESVDGAKQAVMEFFGAGLNKHAVIDLPQRRCLATLLHHKVVPSTNCFWQCFLCFLLRKISRMTGPDRWPAGQSHVWLIPSWSFYCQWRKKQEIIWIYWTNLLKYINNRANVYYTTKACRLHVAGRLIIISTHYCDLSNPCLILTKHHLIQMST